MLDRFLVAFFGLPRRALHAPAQAAAQQPPHRGVGQPHPGQSLDEDGDAVQGPYISGEPVGQRTLQQRLLDHRQWWTGTDGAFNYTPILRNAAPTSHPGREVQIDAYLDDERFLAPWRTLFDRRLGRPSVPIDTLLRLLYLKHRYGLGYETLCREVADSISWRRFCRRLHRRPPAPAGQSAGCAAVGPGGGAGHRGHRPGAGHGGRRAWVRHRRQRPGDGDVGREEVGLQRTGTRARRNRSMSGPGGSGGCATGGSGSRPASATSSGASGCAAPGCGGCRAPRLGSGLACSPTTCSA
jgi:Transposase domain (DUF772)